MAKLAEIMERPRQHWEEDGVVELMAGLMFFLTGAIWWFESTLPRSSSFVMAPPLPWMIIGLACLWGRKMLKERVIAPRAGYVALRDTTEVGVGHWKVGMPRRLLVWFLIVAMICMVQRLTRDQRAWMTDDIWVAFIGVCCLGSAVYYRAWRYLWLGGLSLVLAAWTFLTPPSFDKIDVVMTWLGAGSALMGAIRFRNFLATHPRIEDHG